MIPYSNKVVILFDEIDVIAWIELIGMMCEKWDGLLRLY